MAEKKVTLEKSEKNGNNKGLLIAFIAILFLINCVQFFLYYKGEKKIAAQSATIDINAKRIDSLNTALTSVIDDLKARKDEIAQLGGDTTRLGEQIRTLLAEKKALQNSAYSWQNKYNGIKDKIDAATRLKDDADQEVERLKVMLAKQDTIIVNQKQTIVQREDSIMRLYSEKKVLSDKVAIAAELKAEAFKVESLNSKGKVDDDGQFKAKKIDKVRTTFSLAENKVADKGGRDIYLRVLEPGGGALFDLANGGGSFQSDGKEIFYTMKQNILFENKGQKVSYEYKKGSTYKPGKHTIEIFCEGRMIGTSSFTVK